MARMFADQVVALDIQLFDHIESQTSNGDRKSLLAVHRALAARTDPFSYLEIGSHRPGSPHTDNSVPRQHRAKAGRTDHVPPMCEHRARHD